MIAISRTDRSDFADWWWSIDRVMLAAMMGLVAIGFLLSLAASPAAADRLSLTDPFYFLYRHGVYAGMSVAGMLAISSLDPRSARRFAALVLFGALVLTAATIFVGTEVKGASRWLRFAGFSLQPSEFLKPGLIVIAAWLFAEQRKGTAPVAAIAAFVLYAACVVLLMLQPDFGQTVLLTTGFGALFFLAGMPWIWTVALGAMAMMGSAGAYFVFPHVASRVDRFLNPESGDTYQIDRALEAIGQGGLFGVGPGEGQVKHYLPDAHTDFIFSVAAEEFGLMACLIITSLFAIIIWRGLRAALRLNEPFMQLAAAGLTLLIGLQAFINIAVNLHLVPPKGMTLPFVSYGGSSMMAMAVTAGLLLAMTRWRPGVFERNGL